MQPPVSTYIFAYTKGVWWAPSDWSVSWGQPHFGGVAWISAKKSLKIQIFQNIFFDCAGLNFILNEALSLIGHGLIAFRWPDIVFQNIKENGHFRPKKNWNSRHGKTKATKPKLLAYKYHPWYLVSESTSISKFFPDPVEHTCKISLIHIILTLVRRKNERWRYFIKPYRVSYEFLILYLGRSYIKNQNFVGHTIT